MHNKYNITNRYDSVKGINAQIYKKQSLDAIEMRLCVWKWNVYFGETGRIIYHWFLKWLEARFEQTLAWEKFKPKFMRRVRYPKGLQYPNIISAFEKFTRKKGFKFEQKLASMSEEYREAFHSNNPEEQVDWKDLIKDSYYLTLFQPQKLDNVKFLTSIHVFILLLLDDFSMVHSHGKFKKVTSSDWYLLLTDIRSAYDRLDTVNFVEEGKQFEQFISSAANYAKKNSNILITDLFRWSLARKSTFSKKGKYYAYRLDTTTSLKYNDYYTIKINDLSTAIKRGSSKSKTVNSNYEGSVCTVCGSKATHQCLKCTETCSFCGSECYEYYWNTCGHKHVCN